MIETLQLRQTYIDDFETIIVDGNFSIEIVYNSKPSVNIEADDNLHDVIQFEVSRWCTHFCRNGSHYFKKEAKHYQ